MSAKHSTEYLTGLIYELCRLPKETEWVEFKENNAAPKDIGEYVSALSNAAAFAGKANAYLVWGVRDADHAIVGTAVSPQTAKVGNEELESWLLHQLSPKIHFHFFEITMDGGRVVLLEIERAHRQPVQFEGQEYIRIGSYKKKLKDYPERERALWRLFDQIPFEDLVAEEHIGDDEVLKLIDYPSYFELLELPLPEGRTTILDALCADNLITRCEAGGWNIKHLGAILFAKKLESFPKLGRKQLRIVQYRDGNRIESAKEQVIGAGYASGFRNLMSLIHSMVPSNEFIGQALRRTVPMYPDLAVRELVANALIHQDFFTTGSGPTVEIFPNRLEITNPGKPLVSIDRFVDTPPQSRNESLASLMRRMGICEERGSGIDKVVFQTELFQLPAPLFEVTENSTRATLFAHRLLTEMNREDRIRACYLHACLKYTGREFVTNSSVRARFGIEQQNSAIASRLIKEAVDSGVIVLDDPNAAKSMRRYVPWWARPTRPPTQSSSFDS